MRYIVIKHCPNRQNQYLPILLISLIFVFGLLALPVSTMAAQNLLSVDDRVDIVFSKLQFNRRSKTFDAYAAITNRSAMPLAAPLLLTVNQIRSPGVSLLNADGKTAQGKPFVQVPVPNGFLAPGKTTKRVRLKFNSPGSRRFGVDYGAVAAVRVSLPAAVPDTLPPNKRTRVFFRLQPEGFGKSASLIVTLKRLDRGERIFMNDAGRNGDKRKGDGVFSATVQVETEGTAASSCIGYQATVRRGNEILNSPVRDLCVTNFPLEPSPSDLSTILTDHKSRPLAVADEVIVRFGRGTPEPHIEEIAASVNAKVVGTLMGLGLYQFKFGSPLTLEEMWETLKTLRGFSEVALAEPNGLVFGSAVPGDPRFPSPTAPSAPPDYFEQRGLQKIQAANAWDLAKGDDILIAIVDSGVDHHHPDLSGKVITSAPHPLLTPGCDPMKDYVDNDGDADDEHGHGTHVAGIAAANTDNTGIAGVGWNSQILAVRALNASSLGPVAVGTTLSTAAGIKYAADCGANIINASFSGPSGFDIFCPAVAHATDLGALVIAAAGNANNSAEQYPAACPGAIAVANTTLSDERYDDPLKGSSYGAWVDLAAPGTAILSTVPSDSACPGCSSEYKDSEMYKRATGTSMAAPMVSGAAALLLSCNLALSSVETTLKNTADTATGFPNPGDTLPRINLSAALTSGCDSTPPLVTPPANLTISATGPLTNINLGVATAMDAVDGPLAATPDQTGPFAPGTHSIIWSATDSSGNTGTAIQTVSVTDTPPLVTPPPNLTVIATGPTTAVSLGTATATDAVDGPLTAAPDQTGPFTPGVYSILWSATDSSGNTGTAVQAVSVTDTPPVVTPPPNITVFATGSTTPVNLGSATATDAVDGPLTPLPNNTGPFAPGVHTITWSATDSAGNTGTAFQTLTVTINATPVLTYSGSEDYEANGQLWTRYHIPVSNWSAFPAELFQPAPDLPPCGLNHNASRTWVQIYNSSNDAHIYGFCAFGSPSHLQLIWFAVERGTPPPAGVYIKLHDRRTGTVYRSNTISFP